MSARPPNLYTPHGGAKPKDPRGETSGATTLDSDVLASSTACTPGSWVRDGEDWSKRDDQPRLQIIRERAFRSLEMEGERWGRWKERDERDGKRYRDGNKRKGPSVLPSFPPFLPSRLPRPASFSLPLLSFLLWMFKHLLGLRLNARC